MIINSILAENILKYKRLELVDLPVSGVIAIEGQNESGKSTIGETICLALYGRTFTLTEKELDKVIRWGEIECSVTLTFTTTDGQQYEIARFLDLDGNHSSRISPAGDPDNPIVRGNEAVKIKLYELTGFDFEQFIDSFYLAQREITVPHVHGHTVKTMAGIASLERVMREFEDEIASEEEAVETTLTEAQSVQEELEELEIDQELMPQLTSYRDQVADDALKRTQHVEVVQSRLRDYEENTPRFWQAKGKRARSGFLRAISLLVAAVLAGVLALLQYGASTSLTEPLHATLTGLLQWDASKLVGLLFLAIFSTLLFIVFSLRRSKYKRQMAEYRDKATGLSALLKSLPDTYSESNAATVSSTESEQIDIEQSSDNTGSAAASAARPDLDTMNNLSVRCAELTAPVAEVRATLDEEIAWQENEIFILQREDNDLEQAIEVEQSRLDEANQLSEIRSNLMEKQHDHERRASTRKLACDLLAGAASHITKRFNKELRDLVSVTLPPLTENRYEYLKIGDDLSVKAFSSEKRDFMDLDEISSGTQRQIMLSVRLALAQELINRAVKGKQFLFLDEPFAFFDNMRTRNALEVLPNLSDEIRQIWIVAQQFPEDMTFEKHVYCTRDYQSLMQDLAFDKHIYHAKDYQSIGQEPVE